jgi:mevalonate pyrophosphate decarboxylase
MKTTQDAVSQMEAERRIVEVERKRLQLETGLAEVSRSISACSEKRIRQLRTFNDASDLSRPARVGSGHAARRWSVTVIRLEDNVRYHYARTNGTRRPGR